MSQAKITVLLPTFNRRKFLPDALECIRKQTFHAWQCFIINDGGDDVADIVKSMNDDRFVYYDRPHAGKPAALNFGLSLVKSKYIAYMDDDDEIYPQHLQVLYDAAEKTGRDFVFSHTDLTTLSPDGDVLEKYSEHNIDVTPEMLRFQNFINHKQILHTKALSDKVGPYDEELPILIDFDYIRRMAFISAPYRVQAITGNHILRQFARKENAYSSITGLWEKDAPKVGRAILHLFSKNTCNTKCTYQDL